MASNKPFLSGIICNCAFDAGYRFKRHRNARKYVDGHYNETDIPPLPAEFLPLLNHGSLSPGATSLSINKFLLLVFPPRPSLMWPRKPQLYFLTMFLLFLSLPFHSGVSDSHSLLISPEGFTPSLFSLGHRTSGTFGHLVPPLSRSSPGVVYAVVSISLHS